MTDISLSRKSQLFLLFLLTGIFFLNMLSRLVLAPLLPVLGREFALSYATSGSLFLMIAVGYSLGLFSSGFVSARLTHRLTIAVAAVAAAAAFYLVAASYSLTMIRLGLFLLGIATGLYLPSGMTTLTTAILPANWGKAIAVHEYAPTMAFICAPLIVEGLLVPLHWQGIIALVATASLLLGLFFLRFSPGGNFYGEAPTFSNVRPITVQPAFWIMVVLFGLAVGATVGLFSMMPLYLIEERGIERGLANSLLGLSRFPLLVMALVSGWLSDRFGPKPLMTMVILFNGLMTILLGILPGQWVFLMVFIQPMLTVCFFPAGFTILSRLAPQHSRSLYVSLTMLLANLIGAGLFPVVLGIFGDAGTFGLAFVLFGVLMLLSVILIRYLNLPEEER
ncbi:MAG: MFS transporter [Smithellaceae bacterium]|nr:MFS transporter [Smithellaceae bacterium]